VETGQRASPSGRVRSTASSASTTSSTPCSPSSSASPWKDGPPSSTTYVQRRNQKIYFGEGRNSPLSLPFLSPPLTLSSPSLLLLPFPLPTLRSRPLKSSYVVWGSAVDPAGTGSEPHPKSNMVHFSFNI